MVKKGMGKGKAKKPKAVKKPMDGLSADMYDEIDAFHNSKNRVMLNGAGTDESDDAYDVDENKDVLDIHESSSDSDNDSDKESNNWKRRADEEGDDSESDGGRFGEEIPIEALKNWGRKKKIYY
ncbi:hypothetical protein SARC_13172, partial [Sphaeroforma arctica JP610]